jgi:hypothetical protein
MMAAITHFREMFKLFYGDEVVDGTTTQGTLEPFDQGEHFSQSTYIRRVQSCAWRLPKY